MTDTERDLIAELENTAANLRRLGDHLSDNSLNGLARACNTGAADCEAAIARAKAKVLA